MVSVTARIKDIKQPRGGYLPVKNFKVIDFEDEQILKQENENIHATIIGLAVDYLTRYVTNGFQRSAFDISFLGAKIIGEEKQAEKLFAKIRGLDRASIGAACQLVGYDSVYRAGIRAYKKVDTIQPNDETVQNIKIMVERASRFFENYGPIVKDGFDFEEGYTEIITAGDGDFLTADTLWDFKVSKAKMTSKNSLQLLIYYYLGLYSKHPEFQSITKLGIFNPRLNCAYVYELHNLPEEIKAIVTKEIIGYR